MPKKKSKKKGDILARMSVDQRRQYLERRAAQEQEKTRRREELLAAFLKLKLEDERKKASINDAKLNVKWRSILRAAKTNSLKSHLKNLKLWTEETVSSQDKMIELLISSLQEARHQRTNASQKHLSFIHKLAALHEEHISLLTKDFREQEFCLIKTSANGIQGTARKHLYHLKRMELVNRAANELMEQEENEESVCFQNAVAAIKIKLEEEAALASAEEEEELQAAWWRLATSLKEFEEETRDLRKECKSLQEKVETNMATKEKIEQEVRDMQAEIAMWKSRFVEADEQMTDEDNRTDLMLRTLRDSLATQTVRFRENIKISNRIANSAFERLSETIRLGEEVLYLADLCRRLETVEDKNLPYRPVLPPAGILASFLPEEGPGTDLVTKDDTQREPSFQRPPESDSGVGSSIKTNATFLNMDSERGVENPLEQLPKVTLGRIQKLLKEEALLKEISRHPEGHYKHQQTLHPPSDYIMREAELLLRTNESMFHFWRKLNNVQVQRLSLRKEADDLQRENQQLKKTLKIYLLSQGVSDEGLAISKTPMMVSILPIVKLERSTAPKAELNTKEGNAGKRTKENGRVRRCTPVIEGNSVIKSEEMHSRRIRNGKTL